MDTTNDAFKKRFSLSAATWKRHANPWSVYTGFLTTPFLGLAVWSREWIGLWFLVPLALAIAWILISPRLFPAPKSTDNWASKSVFGERILGRQKSMPVPLHHATATTIIGVIGAVGALQFGYGLFASDWFVLSYGLVIMFLARVWFLDRLVWLYEDMMHTSAEYRDWLY